MRSSGSAHLVESRGHGATQRRAAQSQVAAQRLGDLPAHPHERVERGQRLLEHDLRDRTAQRAQSRIRRARPPRDRRAGSMPDAASPSGSSPRAASEVSDLPEPDSPITPSRSPGASENDTSRTSVAAPAVTDSPETSSTLIVPSASSGRYVAQAVGEEVHAEDEHDDRDTGAMAPTGAVSTVPWASCSIRPHDALGGGAPRPRYDRLASASTATPNWSARRDRQRRGDVRQDVAADDAGQRVPLVRAAVTNCSCSTRRARMRVRRAIDRGHREPDREDRGAERRALHCDDEHREQEHGEGDHDVERRRERVIDPGSARAPSRVRPAVPSDAGEESRAGTDQQCDARPDHELREQVAAEAVGAEQVRRRSGLRGGRR